MFLALTRNLQFNLEIFLLLSNFSTEAIKSIFDLIRFREWKIFPESPFHILTHQHLLIFNNIASFKYCFDNHLIYRLPPYHLPILFFPHFSRRSLIFVTAFFVVYVKGDKIAWYGKIFSNTIIFLSLRFIENRLRWNINSVV